LGIGDLGLVIVDLVQSSLRNRQSPIPIKILNTTKIIKIKISLFNLKINKQQI